MLIKTLTVGNLETNCYIVSNESLMECVVIDPGDESNTILDYLESNHLTCKAILLTHGHFDHVSAVSAIAEETGAIIYMNKKDDAEVLHSFLFPLHLPENSRTIDDGEDICEAGLAFKAIATPGHTPGGMTYLTENALFTGDTLFCGSCGRTDLDGGNDLDLFASLKKICSLEGDFEIYPGHMDCTTLIREKTFNFCCRKAMQNEPEANHA